MVREGYLNLVSPGNRKNKHPFGATRKVSKEQRGVNHANQQSHNGGGQLLMRGSPVSESILMHDPIFLSAMLGSEAFTLHRYSDQGSGDS